MVFCILVVWIFGYGYCFWQKFWFFIQYSGNDIRVSLLSRFLLVALLYFNFFSALLLFFVLFDTLFLLEGENERGLRDKDKKIVESFSFFRVGS